MIAYTIIYFLFLFFIFIESLYYYFKFKFFINPINSNQKVTYKDSIEISIIFFNSRTCKINKLIFFINFFLLIFFNLTFYSDFFFEENVAKCSSEINNISYSLKIAKCSKNIIKSHKEADYLNELLYNKTKTQFMLNWEHRGNLNPLKIKLDKVELGNTYLDLYQQKSMNRFITNINDANVFSVKDQRNMNNLSVINPNEILTDRPYIKYMHFFNKEFKNYQNYDFINENPYFNYQNITFFLTKTAAVYNNITAEYLITQSRFNPVEMNLFSSNLKELFQQTFEYLKQPGIKSTINENQFDQLHNIYKLSYHNIFTLSNIASNPYNISPIPNLDNFYFRNNYTFLDFLNSYSIIFTENFEISPIIEILDSDLDEDLVENSEED